LLALPGTNGALITDLEDHESTTLIESVMGIGPLIVHDEAVATARRSTSLVESP
jgi:hypothetical protein